MRWKGKPASHQGFWRCFLLHLSLLLFLLLLTLWLLVIWALSWPETQDPKSPWAVPLVCACTSHGQANCVCGHCYWTTTVCAHYCPEYLLWSFSPLCLPHCKVRLYVLHTSSRKKLWRNLRQQQGPKPGTGSFSAWSPVWQHRSHAYEDNPGLTCIVHENLSLAEDTEKEQINREIHAKIPGGESEVLKKQSKAESKSQ